MKKILYILSALFILCGCYEDKSTVSDGTIGILKIEGIEEEYSKMTFEDILNISPNVTSTDPADKFEYLWTIFDDDVIQTGELILIPDTIGRDKDLSWPVEVPAGNFTITYRVTNTNTVPHYVNYVTTKLKTNTPFTTGYFLLKETSGGDTELDFFNPDGSAFSNLIEQNDGEPIKGLPTRLGYFINYSFLEPGTTNLTSGSVIVPMGGSDMKMFRVSDMALVYDHSTMFYNDPPYEKPLMAWGDGGWYSPKYISDKGTYSTSQMTNYGTLGTGKYGFSTVPEGGCSYNKHVIVPAGAFGTPNINLFDEENGRFVWMNSVNNPLVLSYDNGFNPENIDGNLLFMSYSHYDYVIDGTLIYFTYNGKAVFENKDDPSQRYIYLLDLENVHNPITDSIPINPALNFSRAQVYCNNKAMATFMMYGGVGDKLYMYNTESDTEKLLTPEGMGSGEEITMLSFKYNMSDDLLMIATHNAGKYKIYIYTTIGTGEPYGPPVVTFEGTGKVVDIQYASTDSSFGSYYDMNY